MKQKKLLIFFLGLLLSFSIFAQNDQYLIEQKAKAYFSALEQKKAAEAVDCLYPKIFTVISKNALLKAMKDFQNQENINFAHTKMDSLSEVVELDTIKYALIYYSYDLISKVEDEFIPKEGEENGIDPASLYRDIYGKENVTYNSKEKKIYVKMRKQMYAILDPDYKDWKFIERQEGNPTANGLIPSEISDRF